MSNMGTRAQMRDSLSWLATCDLRIGQVRCWPSPALCENIDLSSVLHLTAYVVCCCVMSGAVELIRTIRGKNRSKAV